MKNINIKRALFIPGAVLLGINLTALAMQEPDIEILPPGQEPTPATSPAQDPQERMRELFALVERELESIDLLLSDAAAGDTSQLAEAENAGIDRLLRNSVDSGRKVQRDIDELIRIAQEMGQQSSSSGGGGGQPQQSGDSQSSPTSPGQQSQSTEQTPSMPEEVPGGEQEGEQPGEQPGENEGEQEGEQPGEKPGEKEGQDGQQPKSPLGSGADGQNKDGEEQAGASTGRAGATDTGDPGWGNLPQHVRDTFRAEGRGDLPTRYRDWIDSYYHKLNRSGDKR